MSSASVSLSKRGWFLCRAQQRHDLSVSRALRQQQLSLSASADGHVYFWLTVQETIYAVLCQRSDAHEAGPTL